MSGRDIIKLYLIDLFSKNYNFRKMSISDISRRFAYDFGISLTARLFKKFKKVTVEFLEEILETESEHEYQIVADKDDEINVNKTVRSRKKSSSNSVNAVEEWRVKPVEKVVHRMATDNEENHPYYKTLNIFKKTGIAFPRLEITEAKSVAAKIEVLHCVMRNAGLEGDVTVENALLLKEKLFG